MNLTILCTSPAHPVNPWLERWIAANAGDHAITLLRSRRDLPGGDLLLLVSCGEIVTAADRAKYRQALVLHASDLPRGRGWSPHLWAILDGAREVVVTLLEAGDKVDTGAIWQQETIAIEPGALWDEINDALFAAELRLMDYAVAHAHDATPHAQRTDIATTMHRARTPADSRIDPQRTIAEQFDLLRVCDPQRYPAFFDLHGRRYKLTLERMHGDD